MTTVDLQAWHEINSLIHRYARAVDRIDAELGYSVFHPDATADYADFYQGTAHGAIDAICATHRGLLAHSHQITTVNIVIDGDRAGSEAYHFATIRMQVEGKLVHSTFLGRYVDRWSQRDARWAIDHRQVLRDLDETREIVPVTTQSAPRNNQCPSYPTLANAGPLSKPDFRQTDALDRVAGDGIFEPALRVRGSED